MSVYLSVRCWWRPDSSQPVYTGALDLWEAPRYVPIGDQQRASHRVPDGVSDRTYLQQTAPDFAWVQFVVDAVISTWQPTYAAELASERSRSRSILDVRGHEWHPAPAWIQTPVDATIATWGPLFRAQLASVRVSEHTILDVRGYEWAPAPAWMWSVVDATLSTWAPIWCSTLASHRAADRVTDRTYQQQTVPDFTWVVSVVDGVLATWAPAFHVERIGGRTPDQQTWDVRRHEWSQPAWLFAALPTVSTAQLWPAILAGAGLSYRSLARPPLDVRGYEWLPAFSWWSLLFSGTVSADVIVAMRADVGTIRCQPDTGAVAVTTDRETVRVQSDTETIRVDADPGTVRPS